MRKDVKRLRFRATILAAAAFSSCTNVYVVRPFAPVPSVSGAPKTAQTVHLIIAREAGAREVAIGAGFFSKNWIRASDAFRNSLQAEFSAYFSSTAVVPSARGLGQEELAVYPAAWLEWKGVFFPSGTLVLELRLKNFKPGREIVLISSAAYRPSGSWFVPLFIPFCDPLIPSCNLYERRMTQVSGRALEAALGRAMATTAPAVAMIAEWRSAYDAISRLRREGFSREALSRAEAAIARFGFDSDLGMAAALAARDSRRFSLAAALQARALKLARLVEKSKPLPVQTAFGFAGAPNIGYLEDSREERVLAVTGLLRLRGVRVDPAWCLKDRCWAARVSQVRPLSPAWLLGLEPDEKLLGGMERHAPDFALRFFFAAYPGEIVPVVAL